MMSRYSRNTMVIGAEGQKRLSASSVLIIGCGALGSQVAMQLAAAGVGYIGIVDFDNVSISNLQRQIFFKEGDIDHYKSETLASRMLSINSEIKVKAYVSKFNTETAPAIMNDSYDFLIEATDNPESKLNIALECKKHNIPYCTAGVNGWMGQVLTVVEGSKTLADIYPDMLQDVKRGEVVGVMAPTPAVIASLQAAEAIKYITGEGELLVDRLLICDISTNSFNIIPIY